MNKIKVGYLLNEYPYARNVIDRVDICEYRRVIDMYRMSTLFLLALRKAKIYSNYGLITNTIYSFNDFNLSNVDLFHFFNNVSYGKTPWVSTFETVIPRFSALMNSSGIPEDNKTVLKGLEALASPSCKKIIALSECARNFQVRLLEAYPDYAKSINEKLCVLHPPQKLLLTEAEAKTLRDELTFLFVGGDFFRKGGMEMLEAFISVKAKLKAKFKLIIVSTMRTNDYATKSGAQEYERALKLIDENEDWIERHNYLPNHTVIELMKNADVGLLPTWADTYGYSVLEMQAAGCPVITTDIRALPEINNDDTGWLIKLPKDPTGEAQYQTEKQRSVLRETLLQQLEQVLTDIINNPMSIKEKTNASLANINTNHSLNHYGEKLRLIYERALA